MPPRKTKAKAVPPALPLDGLKIALCGTFPVNSHSALASFIEKLGAQHVSKVADDTTHLIASSKSYNAPSVKVKAAQKLGIHILDIQWLLQCSVEAAHKKEDEYSLDTQTASAPVPTATLDAAAPAPAPAPAAAAAAAAPTTNGRRSMRKRQPPPTPDVSDTEEPAKPAPPAKKKAKTAKSAEIVVPVDEYCPLPNVKVYIEKNGTIWDASLNQTNSMQNNNKFYILQVVCDKAKYFTWTHWGRVGEKGQSSMLGDGSLNDAKKKFDQKFKNKSGIYWKDRSKDPIPGKYAYVERSYQPDSDDKAEAEEPKEKAVKEEEEEYELPECTLLPPVKNLVELIFNQQYFAATMSNLNYDANKLPLGKLSKATISRGFQALKDLSALFDDMTLAQSLYSTSYQMAIQNLSNLYYSVIPHAFGRNRPPIISTNASLKREIDLLESLSDMKDAELLMKVSARGQKQTMHPTDMHYHGLGMKEMAPLSPDSSEYQGLVGYLVSTCGATHNIKYKVEDIFRIERQGEQSRFDESIVAGPAKHKRLLWHGSRVTNFAGILSQGLRIAPPEAPVSGYMFGKGIYLADMSSKSANYCCHYMTNNTALLLLCEADLGTPMHELLDASYTAGDDARKNGMYSTLGKGRVAPLAWKDAGCIHEDLKGVQMPDVSVAPGMPEDLQYYLQYNEYIVYDVSQVRLRYLFRVRM